MKAKRCTISPLYLGKEHYMFRRDLLSLIRSLNTLFTAIDICQIRHCPTKKQTYQYKNTKEKLYKTNAAISYNKICKK